VTRIGQSKFIKGSQYGAINKVLSVPDAADAASPFEILHRVKNLLLLGRDSVVVNLLLDLGDGPTLLLRQDFQNCTEQLARPGGSSDLVLGYLGSNELLDLDGREGRHKCIEQRQRLFETGILRIGSV
jgi:hypothetical protein